MQRRPALRPIQQPQDDYDFDYSEVWTQLFLAPLAVLRVDHHHPLQEATPLVSKGKPSAAQFKEPYIAGPQVTKNKVCTPKLVYTVPCAHIIHEISDPNLHA